MSGSNTIIQSISPWVDGTGIHTNTFEQVLSYMQSQFRTIYGQDIYLENDSQDGQLIGVFTKAYVDTENAMVSVYNAYSPSTAQGTGLSSIIKTNGLLRLVPSYSTVDLLLTGSPTLTLTNAVAKDSVTGTLWNLPTPITFPGSGTLMVTATAAQQGAFPAASGNVTQIATPIRGWSSVTNPNPSVLGAPVESDAALRMRQSVSTALPALSSLDSIESIIGNLSGVQYVRVYENDTNVTDANGLPPHSISVVVQGGDDVAIGNAIALKKTLGASTYGTTSIAIVDAFGVTKTVNFYRPTPVAIFSQVTLTAFTGYTTNVGNDISSAIAGYYQPFNIGQPVYRSKLYSPANLSGQESTTFDITDIKLGTVSGTYADADIPITFFQVAQFGGNAVVVSP